MIIPSNITHIGEKTFAYNNSLEKIVIPSSVVEIKKGWIYSTPKLSKIEIMPHNKRYLSLRNGKVNIGKSSIKNKTFDIFMFCSSDFEIC